MHNHRNQGRDFPQRDRTRSNTIPHSGASNAYLLQSASALGVAVAALLLLPTLRRAQTHAEPRSHQVPDELLLTATGTGHAAG